MTAKDEGTKDSGGASSKRVPARWKLVLLEAWVPGVTLYMAIGSAGWVKDAGSTAEAITYTLLSALLSYATIVSVIGAGARIGDAS